MELSVEENPFADVGRAWALLIGGILFQLSAAFAVTISARLASGDSNLAVLVFTIAATGFGALVALVAGVPWSAARLTLVGQLASHTLRVQRGTAFPIRGH